MSTQPAHAPPSQAQLTADYAEISALMAELDGALKPLRVSYESVLTGVQSVSELEGIFRKVGDTVVIEEQTKSSTKPSLPGHRKADKKT
mmetsp:Transcript_26834/g.53511  ORF Transcript_26834/g.53511 Transcript_26834/m.53511 type:complete len:89 (-) Transcript_26834:32-298(-)